jgi:hypothetical protein
LPKDKVGTRLKTFSPYLQELADYLNEEFKLLGGLKISSGKKSEPVSIPPILWLLLAAAFSPDKSPVCFVLPATDEMPALLGCLIAFYDIANRFDDFLKDYERTAFVKGSRVKVRPHEYVFEYDGMWGETHFKLKELQEGRTLSAALNFPIKEIVRLEPTDSKRPKGKLERGLGKGVLSDLDKILDIQTYGNCSMFQNHAVLCATKDRFESFIAKTKIVRNELKADLVDILPWGVVEEDGSFRFDDKSQTSGEPAVALGLRSFCVSEIARKSIDYSKAIILSGPEKFMQDLANFGSILDRQKVIILAEKRHLGELPVLVEHGFKIWDLTHQEICCGLDNAGVNQAAKLFKPIRRSVEAQNQDVTLVQVEGEAFAESARCLEKLRQQIQGKEDRLESLEGLIQRLYHLLLDLSSILSASDEVLDDIRARLSSCEVDISTLGFWLEENLKNQFDQCLNSLDEIIESIRASGETPKSKKLLELLRNVRTGQPIVIPRNKYGQRDISIFLKQHRIFASVGDSTDSFQDRSHTAAFLTGWPNGRRWLKFVTSGISPKIFLLCYDFESRWYTGFLKYNRYLENSITCTGIEKTKIAGLPVEFAPILECPQEDLIELPQDFSFAVENEFAHARKDIVEYETKDKKPAQYVSFAGDSYAYLTPSHEVPVLTSVFASGSRDKVRWETTKSLELGDIVLFRDSGEGNVLREVAEKNIGIQAYADLRQNANLWRIPLQKLGGNAKAVTKFLAEKGLKRDWQTINNWLFDPDHIGPSDVRDIVSIGRITGDQVLIDKADEIMYDIQEVRKQHVLAGHALSGMVLERIPNILEDVSSMETELTLDIGTVWLVTVEHIEKSGRSYPSQYVNFLRWS